MNGGLVPVSCTRLSLSHKIQSVWLLLWALFTGDMSYANVLTEPENTMHLISHGNHILKLRIPFGFHRHLCSSKDRVLKASDQVWEKWDEEMHPSLKVDQCTSLPCYSARVSDNSTKKELHQTHHWGNGKWDRTIFRNWFRMWKGGTLWKH